MGTGQTGGKHEAVPTPRFPGYNEAGIEHDLKTDTWGTTRSFKGSGVRSYTYTRIINGVKRTNTIRAHNIDEADSIALRLGYKTSDRQMKKRKKRK